MMEMVELSDWRHGGFGVYVHWPFCQAKCPYCDFNSHVVRHLDHARWRKALIAEIAHMAMVTGQRQVDTIFFGGGTPSLMEAKTVAAIIEAIDQYWAIVSGAEITLEANPTSVEATRFADYALAGVNRISMGVQALNDSDLKALGRLHTVTEAIYAFDIARSNFSHVSFDLIYARMGQSLRSWREELRDALQLAVDHLSLYQLTIEPGTAFAALYERGKLHIPSDDHAADMYLLTQEMCDAVGMPAYEISNHARPGSESRHNLIYWRYGDYAGVGPGAHSRLTTRYGRQALCTRKAPTDWLLHVEANGHAIEEQAMLSRKSQAEEMVMMGLRLSEGIKWSRYRALAGRDFDQKTVADLFKTNLIVKSDDALISSREGRMVLNSILRDLLI
jgi:oxygen-independent coproporphyrinogen-3 oxidase